MYDAICMAAMEINQVQNLDLQAGENRLYGIVLLSDGQDTASQTSKETMFNQCLPSGETAEGVKIFTIAYGDDADEELLEEIAVHTNGRAYTADPDNIEEVYRQISSEQ